MKYDYDTLLENFQERAEEKVYKLTTGVYNIGTFSEFGTRRRLSLEAQEYIIGLLHGEKFPGSKFVGTSNVMIAMDYGERALGTIAHEFMMCVGQGDDKMNPAYSNLFAMNAWTDEYETQNGIALTDTITTDCFLLDFGLTYATLFNGVRHDSGDPFVWGYKMIGHYKSLGIDPKTKTLLFSDSLDFKRASEIYEEFKDKANVAFGIGTYLANDTFVEPLNIVMKTTACNGHPVAKISDTKGKCMCKNEKYVNFLNNMIMRRFFHDDWT
jgi:nicotinate phosphoribosyltransferase